MEGKCMRLGKMCYGLKQAAYVFHSKVKSVLLALGFEPAIFDACLYFQFVYEREAKYLVAIACYVNNFNIIGERKTDVVHFDLELS